MSSKKWVKKSKWRDFALFEALFRVSFISRQRNPNLQSCLVKRNVQFLTKDLTAPKLQSCYSHDLFGLFLQFLSCWRKIRVSRPRLLIMKHFHDSSESVRVLSIEGTYNWVCGVFMPKYGYRYIIGLLSTDFEYKVYYVPFNFGDSGENFGHTFFLPLPTLTPPPPPSWPMLIHVCMFE